MPLRKDQPGTAVQHRAAYWRASARRLRRAGVSLGLLGLTGALAVARRCAAQVMLGPNANDPLTVRPHDMATGTRNAEAGEQTLDSVEGVFVYVPKKAVGTRRVPLVISLPGGGFDPQREMELTRPLADKYGMIVLTADGDASVLDPAIREVLRKFAIDPDKIALMGSSVGGNRTYEIGCHNPGVFSRLAPLSSTYYLYPCDNAPPPKPGTRFLLSMGLGEGENALGPVFDFAERLRKAGYAVEVPVLNLKPHWRRTQDFDFVMRWLQASWAEPAAWTLPPEADSMPAITAEALASLAKFWSGFMAGLSPDELADRVAYQKPATIPVGGQRMVVSDMVDMPAYAAKSSAAARALEQAGLTPAREQAYRTAFISAAATRLAGNAASAVAGTSVLGKNLALLAEHPEETKALVRSLIKVFENEGEP